MLQAISLVGATFDWFCPITEDYLNTTAPNGASYLQLSSLSQKTPSRAMQAPSRVQAWPGERGRVCESREDASRRVAQGVRVMTFVPVWPHVPS